MQDIVEHYFLTLYVAMKTGDCNKGKFGQHIFETMGAVDNIHKLTGMDVINQYI